MSGEYGCLGWERVGPSLLAHQLSTSTEGFETFRQVPNNYVDIVNGPNKDFESEKKLVILGSCELHSRSILLDMRPYARLTNIII